MGAAFAVAWVLVATKPETPAATKSERVYTVETMTVSIGDARPTLTVYGEIVARQDMELRARVPGPVVELGEGYRSGGTVDKGAMLVSIDRFRFEKDLAERRASAQEARARLDELLARMEAEAAMVAEDRLQAELSARDLARREQLSENVVSQKTLDDARVAASQTASQVIRAEQTISTLNAQISQQRAVIARMDAAVDRAQKDLDDSRLTAPFRAHVMDTSATVGTWLTAGQTIGRLIDIDSLEARLFLTDSQLGQIASSVDTALDHPVTLIWRMGDRTDIFDGRVRRMEGAVDADAGGVYVYAELDSLPGEVPLRAGAFVEAQLSGQLFSDAAIVPDRAVHTNDTVYVLEDGRLANRDITVLARDGANLVVSGNLVDGETLVITRLSEMAPGLRVQAGE